MEGGSEEKLSFAINSLCNPPKDRRSDSEDDLSNYSSCGGESEFERYCSANSALGTPSFRSSSFRGSDFGSLKSFELGDEMSNFKHYGPRRAISGFRESEHVNCSDRGNELFSDEKINGSLNSCRSMNGFVASGLDLMRNSYSDANWGNEGVNENSYAGYSERNAQILDDFQGVEDDRECHRYVEEGDEEGGELEVDEGEDRKTLDEDEALSRYEHSEGEDSMFGCCIDDQRKIDSYYEKNVQFNGEGQGNECQFVMNSTVAFGSDDWDDFVQESENHTLDSVVWDELQERKQPSIECEIDSLNSTSTISVRFPPVILAEQQNGLRNIPKAYNQVEAAGDLATTNANISYTGSTSHLKHDEGQPAGDVEGVLSSNLGNGTDESLSGLNIFQTSKNPLTKQVPESERLEIGDAELEMRHQDTSTKEVTDVHGGIVSENVDLEKKNLNLNPLSESADNQNHLISREYEQDRKVQFLEDNNSVSLSLADINASATEKYSALSFNRYEDHFAAVKTKHFELNDFYDEIVNDMEEILLDSGESPQSRFTQGSWTYQSQLPWPLRDGGSAASTSGTDDAYHAIQQSLRIDGVEVVGARKEKGDVSLTERLVGVKEYTVYRIRVWSGEDHWEVERRYRDFNTLYRQLRRQFADQAWVLPSPWSSVERESRKIFGNASPGVIADRSILIQECIRSILQPKFPSSSLNSLISFLSSSEVVTGSPASDARAPQSLFFNRGSPMKNVSTLGKTISLVVQIRPCKSMKQMLDAQHYTCAGCHKNFDDGRTRVQEFVHALGWGKPRLCEYSGQLFCSSCHNNEFAVLPARVLHFWDFTQYPVSQMAKSYLDSIFDQPMLCVSAVNPFLFSKVPALQHVVNTRNRVRAVLPYVRCPFRRSIYNGLRSRRYLLESNDFFSLKDLIDLSKGVFSALPVMVETVTRKIEEHITEQCLVCYDAGTPCSARQACSDPSSLIFPFQEGEVEKCRSCKSVFHKNCFGKIPVCPCGAGLKPKAAKRSTAGRIDGMSSEVNRSSDLAEGKAESGAGLLAGLFSKLTLQRFQGPGERSAEDVDNVILMGSLPSTSL